MADLRLKLDHAGSKRLSEQQWKLSEGCQRDGPAPLFLHRYL